MAIHASLRKSSNLRIAGIVGKALPAHNEAVHTIALNALNQTSQNMPA
jgi:hypothetical protein